MARVLRSGFDGSAAGEDDEIGERNLFAVGLAVRASVGMGSVLNSFWIASSFDAAPWPVRRSWLTSQSFCGSRRMRAPLAPPRRSLPRKLDAEAQAVVTSWEIDRPEARILPLSASMS